jgi:hypothetical protein
MSVSVTLDPLDMQIADAYEHWQSLPDSVRFTNYFFKSSTDPKRWLRNPPQGWEKQLVWSEILYKDLSSPADIDAHITSSEPGLYIFFVKPEFQIRNLPVHVLYVGMAGTTDPQTALRDRLRAYLPTRIASIKKRKNVHRMLMLFYPFIYVATATCNRTSNEIGQLEKKLYDYLWPMFTDDDFQPEVKAEQQAWSIAI